MSNEEFNHEPHESYLQYVHELFAHILSLFALVRVHCRSPKDDLALLQTAAFVGAMLCGIIQLHGFAVRLFSRFVVENFKEMISGE